MVSAPQREPLRVAVAAAEYYAWVFAAGFVLGAFRVPFLVPRLGERWAELLEMPVMLAVIYHAAGRVVRRHAPRVAGAAWVAVGALALALLVAAEVGLALALQDLSVAEYVAGRDPVSGSAYLASLAVYAVMPWLRSSRRLPEATCGPPDRPPPLCGRRSP